VLEGFRLQATAGARGVGIGGPPGRVGGQITRASSHLVDPPSEELAQAHERTRGQRRGVVVSAQGRQESHQILKEGLPYPFLDGGVGVVH